MPVLPTNLRRQLESVCIQARDIAENAARSALQKRAVDQAEPFAHFGEAERLMRNRLRARGRQVGDIRAANKTQAIDGLTQELAYEYWHRMLFARFLTENHLLMHPDGVPVSLEDCAELARDEGAPNGLVLAARYASRMLPQIFRADDVLLEVEFAPEQRLALEKLLAGLPSETFLADDSLGWVYQFWQAKRKDEVNRSGDKIDGRTLPAVTQLFTEHYMVEFLLHNTIGAWWSAKWGLNHRDTEAQRREKLLKNSHSSSVPLCLCGSSLFSYLRWKDDGTPAAGTFPGWPKTLKEFTMLDPCCGSGHFLVAAFRLLVPLRMHDEGLSARDACDAVLRENLFGLELDPRCTQIAAFALALAAWNYPGDDGQPLGHRALPPLNIACSGQGVVGAKEDWTRFANGDARTREGMERLYDLFRKAPTLGSLIDPRTVAEDLFALGFDTLRGTVERALRKADAQADPDRAALGVAAQGIALAASLMTREFTLVATNVPYLARGKQDEVLCDYIADVYPSGKADLATAFVLRCLEYCSSGGSIALVTPQNWLFLSSYKSLRDQLLKQVRWNLVSLLGEEAWWAFGIRGPRTVLAIHTLLPPLEKQEVASLDASGLQWVGEEKATQLGKGQIRYATQEGQHANPDHRVTLDDLAAEALLSDSAASHKGITTNDDPLFLRNFWEFPGQLDGWEFHQSTVEAHTLYGGREHLILYENGKGKLRELAALQERDRGRDRQGANAWRKRGVAITCMRSLSATLYEGTKFDTNVAAIVPHNSSDLVAVWCYCKSPEFHDAVRRIDQKVNVTNATFVKVPFDLKRWQRVAAEEYPDGLPEPHSNDPTQWLFRGHPKGSTDPLQVAVARLVGYRWPEQEADDLDGLADADGIVPIPAVRGEPPAAERLEELLRAAYAPEGNLTTEAQRLREENNPLNSSLSLCASVVHDLLTAAGARPGTSLDDWLRRSFFEQHCKRFHHRPFVWHVWDGRDDGFSCLVNYHTLTHKALETLTYSYLQDWIKTQSDDAKAGRPAADLRLDAAQQLQSRLKLILAGEPPHDIFVRWKPLADQPIGWNPDLNDGVRLNIRPFMTAGILRKNPNIKWTKDRGKEPERPKDQYPWFWSGDTFTGDRVNDVHLSNAQKRGGRD